MANGALGAGLLGGVLGAVIGAAAVLITAPVAAPPARPDADALREAVEAGLAPLLDELRRGPPTERLEVPRRRVGEHPAAEADRTEGGAPIESGTRPMPIAAVPESVDPLRPEGITWTPPPRLDRVRELVGFDEDVRIRQRWLFLSEREALATFGTPSNVYGNDGVGEVWEYVELVVDEDGDEIDREFTLIFNRGRLVQFWD